MKKVMVYIAEDGTQFKDEKACLSYEKRFPKFYGFKFEHEVEFFDAYSEIPSFRPIGAHEDIENTNAIYADEKAIEKLSCIMNIEGVIPNTIYVYDYKERWWYSLEDVIKIYEGKTKELNKLLSEVGKLIKT